MIEWYHIGGQLMAHVKSRTAGLRSIWIVTWGDISTVFGVYPRERYYIPDDIQ